MKWQIGVGIEHHYSATHLTGPIEDLRTELTCPAASAHDEHLMIDMALGAFLDKSHPPQTAELKKTLGRSGAVWEAILTRVAATYSPVTADWNFSGVKYGWALRLKQKDRVILHLTPQDGQFLAGLVVGEKAAARSKREFSKAACAAIDAAPRYAEGIGVRLTIARSKDAAVIHELLAAKMRER
jgi:Protein of unknown function (DUF3788)